MLEDLGFILSAEFRPFSVAFAVVASLFALEAMLMVFGVSALGDGDVDGDVGFDAEGGELIADASGDTLGIDGPDIGNDGLDGPAAGKSPIGMVAGWIGLGEMPTMIWMVAFSTIFGSLGYLLQIGAVSILGGPLPAVLASGLAAMPAARGTRRFGRILNRIVPRFESTAISERSLGRRRGTVTVGTARRGNPAEVRVSDLHGNMHFLMAEPLDPRDEIPSGAEVSVIRRRDGSYGIVQLSD